MIQFSASALVKTGPVLVTLRTQGYARDLQHGAQIMRDNIRSNYPEGADTMLVAVTEGFEGWQHREGGWVLAEEEAN